MTQVIQAADCLDEQPKPTAEHATRTLRKVGRIREDFKAGREKNHARALAVFAGGAREVTSAGPTERIVLVYPLFYSARESRHMTAVIYRWTVLTKNRHPWLPQMPPRTATCFR